MRIRYQMAGEMGSRVECDLADRTAKKKYGTLYRNGLCEWAELVGEDDDNYMDILEQFDHTETARKLYAVAHELFG